MFKVSSKKLNHGNVVNFLRVELIVFAVNVISKCYCSNYVSIDQFGLTSRGCKCIYFLYTVGIDFVQAPQYYAVVCFQIF